MLVELVVVAGFGVECPLVRPLVTAPSLPPFVVGVVDPLASMVFTVHG